MKNVTFNILKAIQNLRDAGFSESQANSIVSMMGDAFGATVTTKADLAALESRVYRFMVVQTGVTVGLIFAALFILIGGFGCPSSLLIRDWTLGPGPRPVPKLGPFEIDHKSAA